jgi:hypothetical protein
MAKEELPFDATDQEFAPIEAIQQETANAIAQLEVEKHRVRMVFVVNDMNEDVQVRQNVTVKQELARLDHNIQTLKDAFGSVLSAPRRS